MAQEKDNQKKVILLTGATSGIGLAAAEALAKMNVKLYLVGRRMEKTQMVLDHLRATTGNKDIDYLLADLASQESVRNLAKVFKRMENRLDALVHVAGTVETSRVLTPDGVEKHFAVNYLSRFLLTHLLLDLLKKSGSARVVNVSGAYHAYGRIHFEDLTLEQKYSWQEANNQSKLADVLFTYALASRMKKAGIRVNCLHPGAVRTGVVLRTKGISVWTKLLYRMVSWMFRSPAKGAETVVWLATSPEAGKFTGKYFIDKKAVKSAAPTYDKELQDRLWRTSLQLTGLEAMEDVSSVFLLNN
jgi:NAD(P)-dependent dehydrogenase (short-subunit alcohol dehydrogenase family)